jgi:phosphohistidine phosphatase
VKRIARVAQTYGVTVARIQHSGKKRARQTAELLAAILKPADGLQEVAGINPLDDVAAFASRVDCSANTMLVGYLPFLERLTSSLIIGQ